MLKPIRFAFAGALSLAALNACQGGATTGAPPSTSTTLSPGGTATLAPGTTASPTPTPTASSGSTATATPTPAATPNATATLAGTHIYLVNSAKVGTTAAPSITVYSTSASGNATPTLTITGSNTGLAEPQFIAIDPSGHIWVTNQGAGSYNGGSIEEFAPSANGNVAPLATITGLEAPEGIAIDAAGNIFVDTTNSVNEYAPGTTGANPTPMRQIYAPANASANNTGLAGPYGLRVDKSDNVYLSMEEAILVFGPTQSGNVAPTQALEGEAPLFASDLDVALDTSGNLWCSNLNGQAGTYTLNEYSATATGNTAPTSTYTSTSLDEPIGLTFDAQDNMYVANYGNNSILIVAAGSSGTTTSVISGATTGINAPYGIAVH